MSSRDRYADAIDLIGYYEKQQHRSTTLSDNQIALELGWTRGSAHHGHDHKGKQVSEPYGDAGRVRAARRTVDNDKTSLFGDYWFGTRQNGGGRSLSRLHQHGDADQSGMTSHAAAEVRRALQMTQQHEAELEKRIMPTLRSIDADLQNEKAPVKVILAMHDVIRDMEERGRVTSQVAWALIKAGIK
jgi:hypothetical protein